MVNQQYAICRVELDEDIRGKGHARRGTVVAVEPNPSVVVKDHQFGTAASVVWDDGVLDTLAFSAVRVIPTTAEERWDTPPKGWGKWVESAVVEERIAAALEEHAAWCEERGKEAAVTGGSYMACAEHARAMAKKGDSDEPG